MEKGQGAEGTMDDVLCKSKMPKDTEKKKGKRSDKDLDKDYMQHDPIKKKRPKSKKKQKQKQKNTVAVQQQQKKQQSSIASSNSTSQPKNQQTQQPKQSKIQETVAKKSRSKSKKKKSQSRQRSSPSKQKKQPKERKKAKGYVYKPPKQKTIQKQESINEIMRQYSRISRKKKRKSNFYLDKIDSMKWGEPVGRGAKKKKQILQEMNRKRKQLEKQRKKEQKKAKEQLLLNKQAQLNPVKVQEIVLNESQDDVKIQEKSQAAIKPEFDINIYVLENLIDLYTINFYDIQVLSKGLHQLPLKKIRFNCQVLFEKCLEKLITQSGKSLDQKQRQTIIKQLFQPKVANKLINQKDAQLNQYFNKLLYSIHKPTIVMQEKETNYLLTKMQNFSLVSQQTNNLDVSLKPEVKQQS